MRFQQLDALHSLEQIKNFDLHGEETGSSVYFKFEGNNVRLDTGSFFSRQEVFNFAMILIKIAGEME